MMEILNYLATLGLIVLIQDTLKDGMIFHRYARWLEKARRREYAYNKYVSNILYYISLPLGLCVYCQAIYVYFIVWLFLYYNILNLSYIELDNVISLFRVVGVGYVLLNLYYKFIEK